MVQTLGVWCKAEHVMLALARNGELVEIDADDERLDSPALLEDTEALVGVMDAVGRVLLASRPDIVRVLLPEPTYRGSYASLAPRAGLETVVRLAAIKAKIDVELLDRRTARSRLGLPRRGN